MFLTDIFERALKNLKTRLAKLPARELARHYRCIESKAVNVLRSFKTIINRPISLLIRCEFVMILGKLMPRLFTF